MSLTKAKIADQLCKVLQLNKRDIRGFVDSFFENIRQTLEEGRSVKLSGFGNFTLRDKAIRPGRNPKTGESVAIAARRVVTFRAGQKMRERIKRNTNAINKPAKNNAKKK